MVSLVVTATLEAPPPPPLKHPMALGVGCGAAAALCWALGFVAARHGIDAGVSPLILALHRYVWPGVALLPFLAVNGFGDMAGVGWRRGAALALFGGLPLALWSYLGYLFVPLGHGGIIQPSCAAIGGLILARVVLREPLPPRRIVGAAIMFLGLCVIGLEASQTIGMHGVGGDLLFVAAGISFAIFGMLVRMWRINALQAATTTSVLSLVGLPILYFKFDNFWTAGLYENLLQAVAQGLVAGAGAIYLFTRAVVLLGASRAALFPSLVSPFVLLVGFLALGIVPSLPQLAGLFVVLFGFRLTQRG
jgi:drug/metabolite transporter (DMT)-like permease